MTVADALKAWKEYCEIVLFGYSPTAGARNCTIIIREELAKQLGMKVDECILEDLPPDIPLPVEARGMLIRLTGTIIPAERNFYAGKRKPAH